MQRPGQPKNFDSIARDCSVLLYGRLWGSHSETKQQGRENHHLPSPTAEVKNEWICTSTHHYAFHVLHKDNFASSFYEVQNFYYLEFPTSFPL